VLAGLRRWAAVPWRWLPVMLLTLACVGAGVAAAAASSETWTSIWIGVAGTSAAAALVDASAVWEARRRLLPVQRLAARRLGRIHQLLLQIVTVVFDDLQVAEPQRAAQGLRELPEASLDMTTPAAVHPPRSRQQFVIELHAQVQAVREELVALAGAGVLAHEADELDRLLSSSPFMSLVRDAFPSAPHWRNRSQIAADAADVLAAVQGLMPVAAKAAGPTWRYGQWS
jgi:hypothetical protein